MSVRLACLSVALMYCVVTWAAEITPETVVAYVGQEPILYKSIQANPDMIRLQREHYGNADTPDLKELLRQAEKGKLAHFIRRKVFEVVADNYGVKVSEEELKAGLEEWKRSYLPACQEYLKRMGPILKAAEEVLAQGKDKEEAFRSLPPELKISKLEWDAELIRMKDPEHREAVGTALAQGPEEQVQSQREPMRDNLRGKKLTAIINAELAKTDGDFARLLKEKPGDSHKDREKNEWLAEQKRELWWVQQRKTVGVRIAWPEFESVLEDLGLKEKAPTK